MEKLLIIDDETDILDLISDQVEALGLSLIVFKAKRLSEAEMYVKECDFIISDVQMPDSDRLERFLQDSGKPVMRITGQIFDSKIYNDLILAKPFSLDDFSKKINSLLEKKHRK
ncbi:MAG: hypothetical protein KA436_04515 [Oligoflexales bacterium]|nr:hypothetical protein [Oligoflexales bacterium]